MTNAFPTGNDEDIVMAGGDEDTRSPEKSSRERRSKSKVYPDPPPPVPMPPGDHDLPYRKRRMPSTREPSANYYNKQAKYDEDVDMADARGSPEPPVLKRTESSAKKAAGLGGMFGGLLSKSRPDSKRRSNTLTDDEGLRLRREDRKVKRSTRERPPSEDAGVTMTGGATEEDQEARKAARRARRAEREASEKAATGRSKEEDRSKRRRKQQEDEAEARRQEEKESRRAARREQKAAEEGVRQAAEAKEAERAERRRRRAEREAGHTDGEPLAEDRPKKSERRRTHIGTPDEEEARRRRHEERRAMRSAEMPKPSRRKSAPVVDSYFDPRVGSKTRDVEPETVPVEALKRRNTGWPHSGTDSWVHDHASDAPPPPEETPAIDPVTADETVGDERERRHMRKTRRHSKYGDDGDEDQEERKKRRESRRERETLKSSEGSQGDGRRSVRRDSGFVDAARAPGAQGAQGGIFSRWKKMAGV